MTERSLGPMFRRAASAALVALLLTTQGVCFARPVPAGPEEHSHYVIYLLLHEVGLEKYDLRTTATGSLLTAASTMQDRHNVIAKTTTLETRSDLSPVVLETRRDGAAAGETWLTRVGASSATIQEAAASRTTPTPPLAFAGFQEMPASLQMMMMRYWSLHHRPRALPMLRADPAAPPVEIRRAGIDTLPLPDGGRAALTRYTG